MADIRDIMRDRLPSFEKYLGVITASGQATAPELVKHFQKGTITLIVDGHAGAPMTFLIEGTDNKGENRWFNLDPEDDVLTVSGDGTYAITYNAEVTWVRVRWVSGTATSVKMNGFFSKTIVSKR